MSPEELDDLANRNEKQLSKIQEIAADLPNLAGVGYAAENRIKATVKNGAVLSALALDPRVMRMDSATLADCIVEAAQEAAADLQKQVDERMVNVLDQSPFELFNNVEAAQAKFDEIRDGFQQSIDEIMGRVDQIRRNLPG